MPKLPIVGRMSNNKILAWLSPKVFPVGQRPTVGLKKILDLVSKFNIFD
jgi:hypothetical protein